MFSNQCYNSSVLAARQIANNLLPIAKKFQFLFLILSITSLERMSNTLACATQFFYAYFVHVLRCSKQVFHAKIYPEKVLKLSYF